MLFKSTSPISLSGVSVAAAVSAAILATIFAIPSFGSEVAVKGDTQDFEFAVKSEKKKIQVTVSKDAADIERIKGIFKASNEVNPSQRVEYLYSSMPAHRRQEARADLEAIANTREGLAKERSLQLLRIAYGEEDAFNELVDSIDPTMDLSKSNNRDSVEHISACFRVAKPSWLNSENITAKMKTMFEHPNRHSIEKVIFLVTQNNLHQYVPQIIAYHKKYLPDEEGMATIINLQTMKSSQLAFDYVKGTQKDDGRNRYMAFATSSDPEIRKEARKYSRLPPIRKIHEMRRDVRTASSGNIINQDCSLTPEQLKVLVDRGWPDSTTLDDLKIYDRCGNETARPYGLELTMALVAAKVGVEGGLSELNYVNGDEFELYYLVETNPEVETEDIVSFVVNDTLYRFLTPKSDLEDPQVVVDHASPDWHTLDEFDKQNLVNAFLEKQGVKRRIVFLGNPKSRRKTPTGMILCEEPAKLAELKESLSLVYYEGK